MVHYLHLDSKYFDKIKAGTKTIEMRLYDEKRRLIKKGDIIEFENRSNEEKIKAVVIDLHIFKSFKELYDKFDKIVLGYNEDEIALPKDMEQFYSDEEIEINGAVGIEVKLLDNVTVKDLVDSGICPTCFDKSNYNCIYGKLDNKLLYENDDFECFFVGNPRAEGHIAISSKLHFKDMMAIPDELCKEVFVFAKFLMNIIKDVYNAESVYLCTMCDGPMNHFHIQLIPRYSFEKRGSKNFVKERKEFVFDKEKAELIKKRIKDEYCIKFDDIKSPNDILKFMKENIKYGWKDIDGKNHYNEMKEFRKKYRTMSVDETLENGIGCCIEQVNLMHHLLDKIKVENKMFCCRIYEPDDYSNLEEDEHMHCFILYYLNNKVYHLEHPHFIRAGIYEYNSEKEAIDSIVNYYVEMSGGKERPTTQFYDVNKNLSFKEFNNYINSLD